MKKRIAPSLFLILALTVFNKICVAQSNALISNISAFEPDNTYAAGIGSGGTGSFQFSTGVYKLSVNSVSFYSAAYPKNSSNFSITVQLLEQNGTVVGTFSNPSVLGGQSFGIATFTAANPISLSPNTTYLLSIACGANTYFNVGRFSSDSRYVYNPANCISISNNSFSDGTNGYPCLAINGSVCSGTHLTLNKQLTTICSGESVGLSISGGATYTWNPGTITGASVTVTPTTTTVYTVTSVEDGCLIAATSTVIVNPTPKISGLPDDNAITIGTSQQITATTGSGGSVTWEPTLYMHPENGKGNAVTLTPTNTGAQTYTVTSSEGCAVDTRLFFEIPNKGPFHNASSCPLNITSTSLTVCPNTSFTLTATSGFENYTWSNGKSGNAITEFVFSLDKWTYGHTRVYYVSAVDKFGCKNSANITITFQPANLEAYPAESFIKQNGSVTLYASGNSANFSWEPTTGLSTTTGYSVVATPTNTTVYTVTATYTNSCKASATAYIGVVNNEVGEALSFNSTLKNYIEYADTSSFNSTDGTIEICFRLSETTFSEVRYKQNIWYLPLITKDHSWGIFLTPYGVAVCGDGAQYGSKFVHFDAPSLYDDRWHHIVFTFQKNIPGGSFLYIDGQKKGAATIVGIDNTRPVEIGRYNFNGRQNQGEGYKYFSGEICEVRIWKRMLCPDEISATTTCPVSTTAPGLLAYFKFNQGKNRQNNTADANAGKLINAVSGQANGVLMNFKLDGNTSNWIFPGMISGNQAPCTVTPRTLTTVSPTIVAMKPGETANFSASGAASYSWKTAVGSVSGGSSLSVNPVFSTNYTLTATITADCYYIKEVQAVVLNLKMTEPMPCGDNPYAVISLKNSSMIYPSSDKNINPYPLRNPIAIVNRITPGKVTFLDLEQNLLPFMNIQVGNSPMGIAPISTTPVNYFSHRNSNFPGMAVTNSLSSSVSIIGERNGTATVLQTLTGLNKPEGICAFTNDHLYYGSYSYYKNDPWYPPFSIIPYYSPYEKTNFAVSNNGGNSVSVFNLNASTAAPTYTRKDYTVGNQPKGIVAADFNGDFVDDIAVCIYNAGNPPGQIKILTNSKGEFTVGPAVNVGKGPRAVEADIDYDGDIDLVVASLNDKTVEILFNDGKANFTLVRKIDLGVYNYTPISFAAVDLNGDYILDIVAGCSSFNAAGGFVDDNKLAVFIQNKENVFSKPVFYQASGKGMFGLTPVPFYTWSNYPNAIGFCNFSTGTYQTLYRAQR